uniref:Secreted protein n=1 Tax=Steinernema glaseri TaxID=37863 RepID=A0A1I8ACH2_9BILA
MGETIRPSGVTAVSSTLALSALLPFINGRMTIHGAESDRSFAFSFQFSSLCGLRRDNKSVVSLTFDDVAETE